MSPRNTQTGRRIRKSRPRPATTVYRFRITLLGVTPPIWRRIEVQDCTLDTLHEHIQTAMDWTNSHLHHFRVGEQFYGDPLLMEEMMDELSYADSTTTILHALIPSSRAEFQCLYEYDFGDSWEHEVVLESCSEPVAGRRYPVCLDGGRACPPEDVGGTWGYGEFLEAIRDETHEEHENMLTWAGGRFDPEEFDPALATKRMRKGLPDWRNAE